METENNLEDWEEHLGSKVEEFFNKVENDSKLNRYDLFTFSFVLIGGVFMLSIDTAINVIHLAIKYILVTLIIILASFSTLRSFQYDNRKEELEKSKKEDNEGNNE